VEIGEGQGWRLVVDPTRTPFIALIGGDGWATELTAAELAALRLAAGRLTAQHRAMAEGLMAEEAVAIEVEVPIGTPEAGEAGSLWLGLDGDRHHWELRLVLTPAPGGRGIEGGWGADAGEAFSAALKRLRPAEQGHVDQDW
jgi:hypothetical protein